MSVPSRLRTANPHLGAYYGIVTSAFVSLILLLAMFEQLGASRTVLAETMLLAPLALYLLIAIGSPPPRGRGLLLLGPQGTAHIQWLRARGNGSGWRRRARLYRHGVLSRLRRACDRTWLDRRYAHRRRPVRALSAQGRLIHAADVSRPPL